MKTVLLLTEMPGDFRHFASGWAGLDLWNKGEHPWTFLGARGSEVVPLYVAAGEALVLDYVALTLLGAVGHGYTTFRWSTTAGYDFFILDLGERIDPEAGEGPWFGMPPMKPWIVEYKVRRDSSIENRTHALRAAVLEALRRLRAGEKQP